MTNREEIIKLLEERDDDALVYFECPPPCRHDGCPTDEYGRHLTESCEQCKTEWLDAELPDGN